MKEIPCPIPQKWKKYELLADFSLADSNYLKKSIRRFRWSERYYAAEMINAELTRIVEETGSDKSYLFVVKFVPARLSMMLPNFRVQSLDDMEPLKRALAEADSGCYQEIWFCRTYVSAKSFSVAGRILFDARHQGNAQTIEQVWRCSPRLIEVLGGKFPYPFVRASRLGWGWSPHIEKLYLPHGSLETESAIRQQFSHALVHLEQKRELLECFVEQIISTGVCACVLEYKIEGRHLQIIDWDTGDDAYVLRQLSADENT